MGRRYEVVSFLSDAGWVDEYVGVTKAVIADLAPHARVIDLTHGVAAFDVRAGSLALARAIPYVPSGVVLAVVDPGVGGSRRAVAIEVAGGDGVVVGPDNGLLAPAVAMAGGAGRTVELTSVEHHLQSPGRTAAGRDVFAPVAAALCNGIDLAELGRDIDPGELLPGLVPLPREEGDDLVGEVLWVDHYGNCQLNVGPDEIEPMGDRLRVVAGTVERVAVRVDHYGALGPGTVGVLVDGSGMVALVLDRRSAAAELQLAAGDAVTVGPLAEGDRASGVTTSVAMRQR